MAMLLDPSGEVGSTLEVATRSPRSRGGRQFQFILICVRRSSRRVGCVRGMDPSFDPKRGGAMTPMSIVVWFNRAYDALGFDGCSSHSGRRTFITASGFAQFTGRAARCETSNCWPDIGPSRPRSATSMAIAMPNGGWYLSSSNQSLKSALDEGPLRHKIGRCQAKLRSAGPSRKPDPDCLRGRGVDVVPR